MRRALPVLATPPCVVAALGAWADRRLLDAEAVHRLPRSWPARLGHAAFAADAPAPRPPARAAP